MRSFLNSKKRMKAQGSIEFLVILAVFLVMLGIAFIITWDQVQLFYKKRISLDANNALQRMALVAEQVYLEGEGARKTVVIFFPTYFDPSNSSITNHSIILSAMGTTYSKQVPFNITGKMPAFGGPQFLSFVVRNGVVVIRPPLMDLSTYSIGTVVDVGSIKTVKIHITNLANDDEGVSITSYWSCPSITLSVSPTIFSLNEGQEQDIDLIFSSSSSDFCSGFINISVSTSTESDYVVVPISVLSN